MKYIPRYLNSFCTYFLLLHEGFLHVVERVFFFLANRVKRTETKITKLLTK